MIRFASGAAHPPRGTLPPGTPHLGKNVYSFAPSFRPVPYAEVPAFLAGLPSPAILLSTTTQGIVVLLPLDELSGERAAAARASFANQQVALDQLARQLGLAEDARILAEFEDETVVLPLNVLRIWSERFALDVGWNLELLHDDPRAAARMGLFRVDGVDRPPPKPGSLRITSDVPLAHYTDAEMVLSALHRHLPAVMEQPTGAHVTHVWLMLDETGRMERTSVSLELAASDHSSFSAVLLEPFPGEKLTGFESVGSLFVPAGYGPTAIAVKWLQRRADVEPDTANGVYQFDAQRLLPRRETLEAAVAKYYPEYARVGLTAKDDVPVSTDNLLFEPEPDECIVPWFIADDKANVLGNRLGPVLQNPLIARQMIEKQHPLFRFSAVRIGAIRAENGSWPPVVWAVLDPSSPRP